VIDHDRTGLIVDDLAEMAAAVDRAGDLDPLELRREAAERFSTERMVDAHVAAYERLLASRTGARRKLAIAG
jgi:hypothetical protein